MSRARRDLTYPFVIRVARLMFRALDLRIAVEGAEHVPATGRVVLASNHVSFLDFTLVGLAAQPRFVRFMARHEFFSHWASGPWMRSMHHIPVDRAAPAAAYVRARRLLREGEAVGVFPEAGVSQSFTVRQLMPGAVALAIETGAPLVPVTLWGPQRLLTAKQPRDLTRGRPVTITVGAPLDPGPDVYDGTVRLGRALQAQLDRAQGLPRHQPVPGEPLPWLPAHLGGEAPTRELAPADVPARAIRWWEEPQAATGS